MNIMSTRTAPVGAMMSGVLTRATAFGGGGRMTASATDTAPTPAAPAPAAPNTPADTAARLDAQDVQIADHERRIAGLEQRSLPPAGSAEGTQQAPPAASAVAVAPVARMVSSAEIYGRMNARTTELKAAAPVSPAPAVIQTAAGPMLDTRAMYARLNATATARAGRVSRG